ncbi:MAG: endoribonuclease MazF [Candidatus Electryonea clarkiae]|nr:endoribonuclease MazF [Candidatus Electryonea clarkiae]MDP8285780.1 endoribonuclease MazF [Candidatus Electryonea clarkiae]
MVRNQFVPDRGDFIWLSFTPQAGHEQAGRRPALVLSPKEYNKRSGLALVCPVTSQIKEYPFEVLLPSKLKVSGVILSDHVRSVDWRARNAEIIQQAPIQTLNEVLAKIDVLLS